MADSVQCESKNPAWVFLTFFPNGGNFWSILNAYYTFLSTLDYNFLFNYVQHCDEDSLDRLMP